MSGSLRTLQRARVTSTARARAGGTGSASRNAGYPFALRARPRGRSAVSNLIIVLAVVLVAGMVTVAGAVGAAALTTAAAVGALSEGLPDPSQLAEMTFEQPTIVYDRTRQGRARPLPARAATRRDASTSPAARPRRDDDGRGPHVLDERAASTRAAILSAARRERLRRAATAARPRSPSSSSARDSCPRRSPRRAPTATCARPRRSIQSLAPHRAVPRRGGQAAVITAYLNEIFYGHDAYGVAAAARIYFGVTDLTKLTPAQAALLAGLPKSPSTFDPYQYAVEQDGKGGSSSRPRRRPSSAATTSSRTWRRRRWTQLSPAELEQALARAGRPRRRATADVPGGPFHLAGARQLDDDPGRPRRGRDRRLQRHHDARLEGPAARREVAHRRRASCPTSRARQGDALMKSLKIPRATGAGSGPARQGPPQRGAGRARLPDRRRAGLRRQRRLLPRRPGERASSRPSTTPRATARASRARPSSRSSTPRAFDAES